MNEQPSMRLDPFPSIDGAFFWRAAEEGRFVAQKCNGCARLWHPPRAICPACHSLDQGEQELSGRGTVLGWAVPVHPAPVGFAAPPIVGLIALEEGIRFVCTVEEIAVTEMRAGLKVKVGFTKTSGGKSVPVFRPEEG